MVDFGQIIVFVLVLLLFIFPIIREVLAQRKRQQNPEAYKKEKKKEEMALKQFLKTFELEPEDEQILKTHPEPPPAPPPPAPEVEVSAGYESLSAVDVVMHGASHKQAVSPKPYAGAFVIKDHDEASRVKDLLAEPNTARDMILLYVVLAPPKSLRDE